MLQNEQSRVAVKVTRSTNQTIPNNAATNIAYDTEVFDTHAMHDTVTNNNRLTCTIPGLYLVGSTIEFVGNATGARGLFIYTSVGYVAGLVVQSPPASWDCFLSASGLVRLTVGQYVYSYALQLSGGNLDIVAENGLSAVGNFWATRLGS